MNLSLASLLTSFLFGSFSTLVLPLAGMTLMGSVIAYVCLTFPLLGLQSLLPHQFKIEASSARGTIRPVLDRIELAPAEGFAKNVIDRLPMAYWSLGIFFSVVQLLYGLQDPWFDPVSVVTGLAVILILGYLPIRFFLSGSQERLAYISIVQTRLIASHKAKR